MEEGEGGPHFSPNPVCPSLKALRHKGLYWPDQSLLEASSAQGQGAEPLFPKPVAGKQGCVSIFSRSRLFPCLLFGDWQLSLSS